MNVKKSKIEKVDAKENNSGFELLTAILSMFEVILQIMATISINLEPFSLRILSKGCHGPLTRLLKFRIYAPITVESIPITPKGFGNSPIIKGEVIRRKTGVRLTIGKVNERGEFLIASTNKIDVTVLRAAVANRAIQKVSLTLWKEWVNKLKGSRRNKAKNL